MAGIKIYTASILALWVTVAMLSGTGCGAAVEDEMTDEPDVTYPVNTIIDTQAAYQMIQKYRNNPRFIILDVRTKEEFDAGHIEGAVLIDIYLSDFPARIKALDRNKKYLVYCRTANRSAQAAKLMAELGFREVYDMAGGITKWAAEKLPVKVN